MRDGAGAPPAGMAIEGAVVLVTGARGGIGQALTQALLAAGAAEVIVADRAPASDASPLGDARLTACQLDVTEPASVATAAARFAQRVNILINNAGVNGNVRLLSDGAAAAARSEIEVNYFGLLNVTRAFVPAMQERRCGMVVNMLTVLAHVNLPLMASYCASKAAAHSVTQALRAELAASGVQVCGVYPTVVDTAMSRQVQTPKLSPHQLAIEVLTAIRHGDEVLYPGTASDLLQQLQQAPRDVERRMAQRLPQTSASGANRND